MKRILLFLATNIAVLVVLSIVLQLIGVESILDEQGVDLDYRALLIFSAVFGMGGAFISLLLSKFFAKRLTGCRVIEEPRDAGEQWLVETVRKHARAAGIGMPEVAIFEDDSPNAFATGARRNSALVAVSSGLLRSMQPQEVDAVIGHEISHVANGDMVTLTLIQGVVFRNERGMGIGYFVVTIVAQIVLGILASILVMWFSRYREFRADAGGARLAGRENMIAALESLKRRQTEELPQQLGAFGIAGGVRQGLARLMASHPPLDERIARLRTGGDLPLAS